MNYKLFGLSIAKINSKLENGLLLLLLIVLSIIFYHSTIQLFPSYIHAWTQSDRYALALGFIDNGLNFWKPQTSNLATTKGITAVDFPIHEYAIACIMKILNNNQPIVFRLYLLCFALLGYFYLFKLAKLFTPSTILSFVFVLFVFSCPIITYYQAGFIPSITSFAALSIGYYYYFLAEKTKRKNHFIFAIVFLVLAVLTRSTFHIFLFAIVLQQVINYYLTKKVNRFEVCLICIGYTFIIGYQCYKNYLQQTYGAQFLNFLLPVNNFTEFREIVRAAYQVYGDRVLTIYHLLLLLAGLLFTLFNRFILGIKWNRLQHILLLQVVLILAGAFIFFLIMAQQFRVHDYYMIDTFLPGIFLFFLFLLPNISLKQSKSHVILNLIVVACIAFAIIVAYKDHLQSYTNTYYNEGEVVRKNFTGSSQFLDSIGISKNAKILVLNAQSTNAPLLLMQRKGYTVVKTTPQNMIDALQYHFDYIAVMDISLPSDLLYHYPQLQQQLIRVNGNGKISIFTLEKYPQNYSLQQLLGVDSSADRYFTGFEDTINTEPFNKNYLFNNKLYYSGKYCANITPNIRYGPSFLLPITSLSKKVLVEGYFYSDESLCAPKIALNLKSDTTTVYYFDYENTLQQRNSWQKFGCLFDLSQAPSTANQLTLFIWNVTESNLYIDDLEITIYN